MKYDIEIHTISPAERSIYTKKSESQDIIVALFLLSRANNESILKQERLQESWGNKRKIAIEQKNQFQK